MLLRRRELVATPFETSYQLSDTDIELPTEARATVAGPGGDSADMTEDEDEGEDSSGLMLAPSADSMLLPSV